MSSQTQLSTNKSSPVRKHWLPLDLAVHEVITFESHFGPQCLKLACHAALPSIVSPQLLNLIHINFLSDESISWLSEIDFLLSPLCRSIGEELFEIEPSIREVLMFELEKEYGIQRRNQIAQFYHYYLSQTFNRNQNLEIVLMQQWFAEAYLFPDKVISEMTSILEKLTTIGDLNDASKQILIANAFELLAEPLQNASQEIKYSYLVKKYKNTI